MERAALEQQQEQEAFKFAQELIKQLVTLATGVLTLTLTFLEKVNGASGVSDASEVLRTAWVLLVLSIIAGLFGLMGLTGALSSGGLSINTSHQKLPVIFQIMFFVVGVALITYAVAFQG